MNTHIEAYENCLLCPRNCKVNRNSTTGFCKSGSVATINIAMLHHGEEPPISGDPQNGIGSGTIFFEGCSIRCPFCQNYSISSAPTGKGMQVTPEELAKLYLNHQASGAYNINLVTPMHFAPSIKESLIIAKAQGLNIPVAINTGGYEKASTLGMLDGLVDIYMPDFKFWDSKLASSVLSAPDYRDYAIESIAEMYRQVGPIKLDPETGLMKKGLIVRHLMMPGKLFDTKKILDYLTSIYGNNIYISLMSQYTPMPQLHELNKQKAVPEFLFRNVPAGHYDSACDYLASKNQENAFVQDSSSQGDEMIPPFIT